MIFYCSLGREGGGSLIVESGNGLICIIMPFILYGCETWSVKSREGQESRLIENRLLRGMLGLEGLK